MSEIVTITAEIYNSINETTETRTHTMSAANWDSRSDVSERRRAFFIFIGTDGDSDYMSMESFTVTRGSR